MKIASYKTVDEYISTFPKDIRVVLENLRQAIKKVAPGATETIAYGIPTFKLHGKNLVHFGGYKTHIGFYPAPRSIEAFKKELAGYEGSKGTIKFPLGQPLPLALITKIVKFRIIESKNK